MIWLHIKGIIRAALVISTLHRAELWNSPVTDGDQRDPNIFILHFFFSSLSSFAYLQCSLNQSHPLFSHTCQRSLSIFKCFVIKHLSVYSVLEIMKKKHITFQYWACYDNYSFFHVPYDSSSGKHQSIDVFQLQRRCLAYDVSELLINQDIFERQGSI